MFVQFLTPQCLPDLSSLVLSYCTPLLSVITACLAFMFFSAILIVIRFSLPSSTPSQLCFLSVTNLGISLFGKAFMQHRAQYQQLLLAQLMNILNAKQGCFQLNTTVQILLLYQKCQGTQTYFFRENSLLRHPIKKKKSVFSFCFIIHRLV